MLGSAVLVVPKHWCNHTKILGWDIRQSERQFLHSRSESIACRNFSNVLVSSVGIWVVVAWKMTTPSARVLFTVSKVSSHFCQVRNKSNFLSRSLLSFPPWCSDNYPMFSGLSSTSMVSVHLSRVGTLCQQPCSWYQLYALHGVQVLTSKSRICQYLSGICPS